MKNIFKNSFLMAGLSAASLNATDQLGTSLPDHGPSGILGAHVLAAVAETPEGKKADSQPASPIAMGKDTGFPVEAAAGEQSLFKQVVALYAKVLSSTKDMDLETDKPSMHSALEEFSALGRGELTDELLRIWKGKFQSILKELEDGSLSEDDDLAQPQNAPRKNVSEEEGGMVAAGRTESRFQADDDAYADSDDEEGGMAAAGRTESRFQADDDA